MKEIISFVMNNPKAILDIIAYGIAIASIIVKITPSEVDNKVLDRIIKILGTLSIIKR